MPRKKKQDIKVNNTESLEGVVQEVYNDACLQITEAQKTINELSVIAVGETVDDHTKIAREKGNLLKVKDSGIRIKLEVAKLQSDILKHSGDVAATITDRTDGSASISDFDAIRAMLKQNKSEEEED